jgi:LysR family transcriptional regulator, glycine cleavage system transcriptional activator
MSDRNSTTRPNAAPRVPRGLPSLDLLKGFESAARHLNFTRAAEELFLTQSAVSRQVQVLEERLGVRLFLRERRGLRLTHEGDRMYRTVQSALRQVQEAVDSLAQRSQNPRVTLTSTMAFCSLWLIPRLGAFQRDWPEVDVRIAAHDKVLNLERERVEVSVRYCPAPAAPEDAQWLFDEELTPVCSPSLLAAGPPLRRPQDLESFVLLHLEDLDNPSPWLSWSGWLDACGVRGLQPAGAARFNYFDQVVRATLAGHGVAMGRLPLVQDLLRDGSLVAPFSARISTGRAYWVVRAGFSAGRSDVDHVVEWITAQVREDNAVREAGAQVTPARGRVKSQTSTKRRKEQKR